MFCNISIFTTSCNYTLRVYFENCIPYMWSRPVPGGNSAERWRRVRLGVAGPGPAPRSCLLERRHRRWLVRLRRDFPFNSSPRSSPRVTFVAGPAPRPALATVLATAGLRPLVSPGKRSAASVRDHGRARVSGSVGAEDAGAERGPAGCAGLSPTLILSCASLETKWPGWSHATAGSGRS